MTVEEIAKVCHEANKAYCETLGDMSQPSWEDVPIWQRSSAILGVNAHFNGYVSPEQSHILWMGHKLSEGWKFGTVKNADRKEHPCLVPYAELPIEQQKKDALFGAIVQALLYI